MLEGKTERKTETTPVLPDPQAASLTKAAIGSPHAINFSWLIKLRWGAIAGQLVTIAFSSLLLDMPLALVALGTVIALEALSNLGASLWQRSGRDVSEASLVLLLVLDIVFLTALLSFSGGPSNPFNFLYLVHIALAAVVLRSGWTWGLLCFSVLASGTLFLWDPLSSEGDAGLAHHAHHMRLHLEGMWVAFAVAAAFIAYFVTRVRRALAQRELDLESERRLVAVNEKLAALATLAAGAAHELATPLGTIAVVTRELERRSLARQEDCDDIGLIRKQVDRCREILDGMASDAGAGAGGGFFGTTVEALLAEAARDVAGVPQVRVEVRVEGRADGRADGGPPGAITVPLATLARAIRGVIRNAQEASPPGSEVVLRGSLTSGELLVEVEDRGTGMSPEVLRRAGEPFFTTKAPGRGMGLGLFLTRTLTERLGGRLEVSSRPSQGTLVKIRLPADAR
ncbi:MAG TPA: ATP-binding protein, partial [Polyangia bacterium]